MDPLQRSRTLSLTRRAAAAGAALLSCCTLAPGAHAQPWAPGQEPPPTLEQAPVAEARQLEQTRLQGPGDALQQRYLRQAHALLQRFWQPAQPPRLLLAGERAEGCGVGEVRHPLAFYCPESREIGMAINLRRSVRSARGKDERALLMLELAVLAHEWGHHVNREKGRGPYSGGLEFTARQEELAADWRTGVFLGWLLANGIIAVDDFTETANLLFEMGDYERILPQHHGYPKDRLEALGRGVSSQLVVGQRLGAWSYDSRETFSRPLPQPPGEAPWLVNSRRMYSVRRFEIDRSNQVATNLVGGLLGVASCLWGSQQQCLGMALQQGKGRADGMYTLRTLTLDCDRRTFDVSDDDFGPQPLERDGKGQALLLAARDCRSDSAVP